MTTNEERRKVAQMLRECRGGWSSGECYYTIIHALGLPDTSREDGAHALYAALADLIDPEPERTPNDDERRRVSGELERLVVYENGTTSLNHGVLWSIAAIVLPDIDERPRETVLADLTERLAELIKPERT